jgi:hypothetical protein
MAPMLMSAKQVISAAALLKSPPNGPTNKPATSGPKAVMTRPVPFANETAVDLTCVGNSSGR